MTDVTDNFNRADGSLGSNWLNTLDVSGTPLAIASNAVTAQGANVVAYWNPAVNTFSADQHAQVTYVTANSGNFGGVLVRHDVTGHSNFYLYYENGPNDNLYRFDSGSFTQIHGTSGGSAVAGDVVRLEVAGTTFTMKRNGTTRTTQTDATYSSGQPGLGAFQGGEKLDDWSGGPIVAAAASVFNIHPFV
jgi:hypothetical protein